MNTFLIMIYYFYYIYIILYQKLKVILLTFNYFAINAFEGIKIIRLGTTKFY